MAPNSGTPINHTSIVCITLLSVALLYSERGVVHALGILGWLAVALAALFGGWGGWQRARRYLTGTSRPSPWNRAALPLGVGLSLLLSLILGRGVASDIAVWPIGVFFVAFSGCFYATYAFTRLTA